MTKSNRLTKVEPPAASETVSAILALVKDPTVDTAKLERLIAMHQQFQARDSLEQFSIAMADAQAEMRMISTDAQNPQTRSRYATFAKLDSVLRPIYSKHGFALSFDTADSPHPECVRVLCYLSHRGGFSRTHHIDMPNDGKGARGADVMSKTHAQAAAMSYGMRYLLRMIFSVSIGEEDVDGNRVKPITPPHGFDQWVMDLEAVAVQGTAELEKTWFASDNKLRKYLTDTDPQTWDAIKAKAATATAGTEPPAA